MSKLKGEETVKNNILEERIKEIIEKKLFLKKNADGTYLNEVYIEHHEMHITDTNTLVKLSEGGKEAVYEYLDELYMLNYDNEIDCIKSLIREHLGEDEFFKNKDIIDEFIADNISIVFPDRFVWSSPVCVNLIIEAFNESEVDFTRNCFSECDKNNLVLKNGSIKWLINQQGYSVDEFNKEACLKNTFSNNFYSSIFNELSEATSSMNALTTSFIMTLKDVIELKELLNDKKFSAFKLDKKCNLGLVDFWSGTGSMLSIKLENNLVIPIKNIFNISIDSAFEYGLSDIYGIDSFCYWNEVPYEIIY